MYNVKVWCFVNIRYLLYICYYKLVRCFKNKKKIVIVKNKFVGISKCYWYFFFNLGFKLCLINWLGV